MTVAMQNTGNMGTNSMANEKNSGSGLYRHVRQLTVIKVVQVSNYLKLLPKVLNSLLKVFFFCRNVHTFICTPPLHLILKLPHFAKYSASHVRTLLVLRLTGHCKSKSGSLKKKYIKKMLGSGKQNCGLRGVFVLSASSSSSSSGALATGHHHRHAEGPAAASLGSHKTPHQHGCDFSFKKKILGLSKIRQGRAGPHRFSHPWLLAETQSFRS